MSVTRTSRDALRDAVAALPAVIADEATVTAVWVPEIERSEEKPLRILVAPSQRTATVEGRGVTSDTVVCDVGVFGGLTAGSEEDQGEAVQAMADAIIAGLLTQPVGTQRCIAAEQVNVMSVDYWRRLRMTASFIQLTLR